LRCLLAGCDGQAAWLIRNPAHIGLSSLNYAYSACDTVGQCGGRMRYEGSSIVFPTVLMKA